MKLILAFLFVISVSCSFGQTFSFPLSSRTLVKTTDQSPAHWYLEIVNNYGSDTTLRWKTTFVSVPPEWGITFDDQNTFYNPIVTGDSADFTLYGGLTITQKLIIGAVLNGTTGHAFMYFDVYDPENVSVVKTIYFEFIVTESSASIEQIHADDNWYSVSNGEIVIDPSYSGERVSVYSSNGSLVKSVIVDEKLLLPNDLSVNNYILVLESISGWRTDKIAIVK